MSALRTINLDNKTPPCPTTHSLVGGGTGGREPGRIGGGRGTGGGREKGPNFR